MNFLTSIKSYSRINDFILLAVRLFVGFGMISHGFPKLMKFSSGEPIEFYNFLGLGAEFSLGFCIFIEVVCSIFVILGLFSRVALSFLLALTAFIALIVHGADPFSKQEMSLLYLCIYSILMAFGPGIYSVDGLISQKRANSGW